METCAGELYVHGRRIVAGFAAERESHVEVVLSAFQKRRLRHETLQCGISLSYRLPFSPGALRLWPPTAATLRSELRKLWWLLEVDDEAGGDAGAIGARARGVET